MHPIPYEVFDCLMVEKIFFEHEWSGHYANFPYMCSGFWIFSANKKNVVIGYMYPIPFYVFWLLRWERLKFRSLCLSPLSGALCHLSKWEKKGGSFHFEAVPLKSKMYPNSCRKKVYLENGDWTKGSSDAGGGVHKVNYLTSFRKHNILNSELETKVR